MLLLVKQYLILAENIQSEHEKREERTDTSSCESDVLQIARGNLVPFSFKLDWKIKCQRGRFK